MSHTTIDVFEKQGLEYGDKEDYENVALECVDCNEVLLDYDGEEVE